MRLGGNGGVTFRTQIYDPNLGNGAGTYVVCWDAGTGQLLYAGACGASDVRLKTNIGNFEGALRKVEALRPVNFEWKDQSRGKGNQIGLIAQEVEKIVPEVVSTGDDGIKSIDYAKFTPILIKGMQEQQAEIESQNTEIESLMSDNAALKRGIEELRSALRTK